MTNKALEKAEDYLDEDWRGVDEDDRGAIIRAQVSTITTVLSTQAKVDEARLRRQNVDRLPELLKLVAEVEARLPLISQPVVDIVPEG